MIEALQVFLLALIAGLLVVLVALGLSARAAWRYRFAPPPMLDPQQMTQVIEAAIDAAISKRLPTAEQFQATVRAIVIGQEAARHNGGGPSAEGRS